MTHPAVEAEIEVLRGQVKELEGELARYRELVERLKVEIAACRKREELHRTFLTASGTRPEGMALDARRASEAILEQAEARLSAALERLRASSNRADSATSRERL
jgi:predicted  nucleic acid-binding Zn-ribbon protein